MVLTREPAVTDAESLILKTVQEHDGRYSPAEVIEVVRQGANVRDDIVRAALWFLLDRRSIVLTPGWRVATPHASSR